jgi:8-oxo-dGTP pyrophosphatase MutT (NUDIX family)
MHTDNYCNNCGKPGHSYSQCKTPITSNGIVVFRRFNGEPQYLMIRRKDSLGHIDFMRGKYSVTNKHYIINMLKQMTLDEKLRMKQDSFDKLWDQIWGGSNISSQYKNEEGISREKFNTLTKGIFINGEQYNLSNLIDESMKDVTWEETEWGFPKGRRNNQEKDFECALREFNEETGYPQQCLKNVQNILPYEEIFTGSNYKSYKHKYYLMYMSFADSQKTYQYDTTEVSKMEWKTYDECVECIRDYNKEKIQLLSRIHNTISKYNLFYI